MVKESEEVGLQIGFDIQMPNHLNSVQIAAILSKSPDFEWSGSQMVGIIAIFPDFE